MKKTKIKVKNFEKSFERFVRLRAVPSVIKEIDNRYEGWPVWDYEFEVKENKLYDGLMIVVDRMIKTYKQKQYKSNDWHSSRKIFQNWSEHVNIKQGMPDYLQLTFLFTKLDDGKSTLQFKLHIKRIHCKKKRIALMIIPL